MTLRYHLAHAQLHLVRTDGDRARRGGCQRDGGRGDEGRRRIGVDRRADCDRPRRDHDPLAGHDARGRSRGPGLARRARAAGRCCAGCSPTCRPRIRPPARSCSRSRRTCWASTTPRRRSASRRWRSSRRSTPTRTRPRTPWSRSWRSPPSGVQLIPASMIGVLAAAGSTNPTAIIAPTILATSVGTVAAVIAARLLQPFYPLTPPSPTEVRS